jgi:hypothetical protein
MNKNFILDDAHIWYESNQNYITISQHLLEGAETVSALSVASETVGTHSSANELSTTIGNGKSEINVRTQSVCDPTGTTYRQGIEDSSLTPYGESCASMVIDKDTRQKSLSYSEITEEQRNVLQFALQSKKKRG